MLLLADDFVGLPTMKAPFASRVSSKSGAGEEGKKASSQLAPHKCWEQQGRGDLHLAEHFEALAVSSI